MSVEIINVKIMNFSTVYAKTTPPHTHTHSRKQRHENKHSRMQGEWTEVRNFPSQERKQKQKSLLTSKIRKQK